MTLENQVHEEYGIMQLKLVYWGPGESGKTTNYLQLLKRYSNKQVSSGFKIETTDRRTLWQDSGFLTFKTDLMGKPYRIVIQIVTCTGQERFLSTREYVLHGADGIIFVADSDPDKIMDNLRSFQELLAFISSRNIPFLIQLNKRDLADAISIEQFKQEMGLPEENVDQDAHLIVYPCVAIKGTDVYRVFQDIIEKILLNRLLEQENGL